MKFQKMNLPNKLTTIRMWCVPLVIVLFTFYGLKQYFDLPTDYLLGKHFTLMQIFIVLVFAFASITDFLDGNIARKNHLVSDFGKIMDPLADKLLVNITLICLIAFHITTYYSKGLGIVGNVVILIIIARDLFVDALRMQALKKGVVSPAKIWGKLKTATLMPGIIFALIGTIHPILYYIGMTCIILGGVFALIGGVDYYKEMAPYFEEESC